MDAARNLEIRLGHSFADRALLDEALTHRSYANENGLEGHYERLEFLGDSVLGLLAAEWLFSRFPEVTEGRLSRLKALLVSESALSSAALEMGLGETLRLGVGEERSGGREKPSLLADALEAVIGAVFLDAGIDGARAVVSPILERALELREGLRHVDAKTRLQETVQARGWELPEYRLVAEEGPDHEKRFSVECWLRGRRLGAARGRTKKRAEQRAAGQALAVIDPD